jgi:PAS domain S-box-containing protein
MQNLFRDEAELKTRENVFAKGAELGELMRAMDWSRTSLGPVSSWPQSLRTAVGICLHSRFELFIWWGPEMIMLYNDAYRQTLRDKHPWALGKPGHVVWAEIWPVIGPMLEHVMQTGEATWSDDLLLFLERHGYPEETYHTFSYSPIFDESGSVGGIFTAVTQTTEKVIGERRLRTLRDLAARTADAKSESEAWKVVAEIIGANPYDVQFAALYRLASESSDIEAAAYAGVDPDHTFFPRVFTPEGADGPCSTWIQQAVRSGKPIEVHDAHELGYQLPGGAWNEQPSELVFIPLLQTGQARPLGVLVAGVSRRKRLDEQYRGFFNILAGQISKSIADAQAFEKERKRAEALAEIDRAKTAFFSNVSHEFRTPLTLMLGPLEDTLSQGRSQLGGENADRLETVHRNSMRLLKLVNSLLDFSRIEAGRLQASYEAVDLGALTSKWASGFRAAVEKAGLYLRVESDVVEGEVYVDRDMWEKVVLNLLSNAFKFTFAGGIDVAIRDAGDEVELRISDTGTGIPEKELARLFERFHRVEGAKGRSFEGSGIGLALVQELVKLHGGNISVKSAVGAGTTFLVNIPKGKAHLPSDRINAVRTSSTSLRAEAYVDEALRWAPEATVEAPEQWRSNPAAATGDQSVIVLADDNADMRDYLASLLRQYYEVHAVGDGMQALATTRQLHPALVLTDVMMPGLDGFGVLQAIRDDSSLSDTPVILLSARAGEESRVEGLQAGADDYLIKPFTARELLARVATHVRMAKSRREASDREASLRALADLERHRLRELLAQVPAAIGLTSGPEHRWVYVNEAYVRLTGRSSPADFLGKTVLESMPELATQSFIGFMDDVYRTGKPYFASEMKAVLNRSASGLPDQSYWDFAYQPIRNTQGGVEGILIHGIEVSDKVVARKASQHLAAIVGSSDAAIVSKDLRGIVTSWNPAAEKIFGYPAEEMIGRSITTIIPPELQDDEQRILETIGRGERISHFDTVRLTKSGERIDVSLTISPVRDEAGRITGAAKIARDITQQKKAEQVLRTTERLASVGRLAATVAHEINNPLEALTNLIYLARETAMQGEVRGYLASAEEELDRISHLARQTLGFYRETKGISDLTLGSVIHSLLLVFASRMRNKRIEVSTDIKDDPRIRAVPGEVRQLIANLLSNSIDAVDAGGRIRVRLSSTMRWNGTGTAGVRLSVADSGAGIPAPIRSRLFEPFFTTKKEVGTGLGLWVCKNIVEQHHGSISVKSSTGPGKTWTVFSVFLPFDLQ